jgi:hypothetical protein
MSGDRISDEAVLAARVAFDEAYNSDGVSWANAMRSAIAAALPLLEGGKGEKAVQDELPLATPVPPVDWKAVYANEATKFRAETIRTSELTAMVKRCVSVLIDDHPPGPWSRGCIRCKIVEDAEELLARPINVAAIPLYTAPQPAAPQPAEPVAGGAVDARIADLSALRSSVQSMRDRMMRLLPEHFGDGFDGDYDTMLEVIIWIKSAIAALRANTEKSK